MGLKKICFSSPFVVFGNVFTSSMKYVGLKFDKINIVVVLLVIIKK